MSEAPLPRAPYRLMLFIAGGDAHAIRAKDNLAHICAEHLSGGVCEVTIIDVTRDFQAALDHVVLVTPTLLVDGPQGRATILGDLSNIDRMLFTLGPAR